MRSLIIVALHVVAGAIMFGAPGAYVGLVVGVPVAGVYEAVRWLRTVDVGETAVFSDRVLCLPMGGVAECDLVRDVDRGRWTDVQRCSQFDDPDHVTCEKNCLVLMNAAA